MSYAYGNLAGPGPSYFRVVCEYRSTDLNNGYYRYSYRYSLEVTAGDFYGTAVFLSWGSGSQGSYISISTPGTYAQTGWYTKDVLYGSPFTIGGSGLYAQYTAYDGVLHRSMIAWDYPIETLPVPSYTVSYNANGGSGAPAPQTKRWGQTLTLSSTVPTRSGYTFLGWSTTRGGSVQYQPGGRYTSNMSATMYAVWSQKYTVVYDAQTNGGTVEGQGAISKEYNPGDTFGGGDGSALPVAEKQNHRFVGWNTRADGTGLTVTWDMAVDGNARLYALFELQANCYYKQNGQYRTGMMYIRSNGVYKTGTVSIRVDGDYKDSTI